jgi:hypothetical protein
MAAAEIVEHYFRRLGRTDHLDATWHFEVAILRDMLNRLEVVLEDEHMPPDVVERVIRCMLYGSPSAAAAEQRKRRDDEMIDLLQRMPPRPVTFPGHGIPPG